MNYLNYGLLALVAAAIQVYYCFKVVQQRRRTRRRWGNDQPGFAPNLSSSDDFVDPANPYSSPAQNRPNAQSPIRSRAPSKNDPDNVMEWLDQQQRGK